MVKILSKLDEISQDKKVIIDFFAEWCGPCKRIAPQYIELSEKYSGIEFFKCDVDESSDLSEVFEVNALPTFVFLLNGKVVNKIEGADIEGLKELLEDLNSKDAKEICVTTQKDECCANKNECTNKECITTQKEECCSNKNECTNKECVTTQKEECCANKNDCSKASCGCNA